MNLKPFKYDAIETPAAVMVIFPHQGADGLPATSVRAPGGFEITRADGMVIRLANIHPRLRHALDAKPVYAVEVADYESVIYATQADATHNLDVDDILAPGFYWFIGPETSTLAEVGERPFAKLAARFAFTSIVVAPGQAYHGPLIGMCVSGNIVPAVAGRRWCQVRKGLIVDLGVASGTTTGFPANDNVIDCVSRAHSADVDGVIQPQPRRHWASQIGIAFRPDRKGKDPS